jgi:hypothetical protein
MTFSSSRDFDPFTQEDIDDFRAGLEYDKPTEILSVEMAARAIGDVMYALSENDANNAGSASGEDIAYLGKILTADTMSDSDTEKVVGPDDQEE